MVGNKGMGKSLPTKDVPRRWAAGEIWDRVNRITKNENEDCNDAIFFGHGGGWFSSGGV